MGKKLTHQIFLERIKKHPNYEEYEWQDEYQGLRIKIPYRHKCGYLGALIPENFMNGVGGCPKCGNEKRKATCLEKYGVENIMLLSETKEKIQKTCIEKYGVDHPSKAKEVQKKRQQTCIERYGVDHPSKTEEVKEKKRQTSLSHFGVENPLSAPSIREKIAKTNLRKYGYEVCSKSEGVKKKQIQTNLERYGAMWTAQNKEVRTKIAETNLRKYGYENPMQNPEISKKAIENTSIFYKKKYGASSFFETEEFQSQQPYFQLKRFHGEDIAQILNNVDKLRDYLASFTPKLTAKQASENLGFSGPTSFYARLHKFGLWDLIDHSNKISSFHEDFLSYFPTDDINNRIILDGLEIDCYYPDQKIGIELNGTYWHSENTKGNKDSKYHNNKTKLAAKKGIRLIHIFEHQWYNEKDKWINFILNALGYNEERIYARETYIAEISVAEYRRILDENHLQSYAPASIKLGLYSKKTNELVFAMGFKRAKNTDDYTLERMASSKRVVGGANKCLSYFIKTYSPSSIETFCDTTTFTGNVYEKMGFEKVAEVQPMYVWVNMGNEVIKRRSAQKANIIKRFNLPQDHMNKTENEIMTELGYYKIWGCNLIKYQWKPNVDQKKDNNNGD